jgi:hypothetical protein
VSTNENGYAPIVDINNTLFVTTSISPDPAVYLNAVGIRKSKPTVPLEIVGSFGVSTLSTGSLYAIENINMSTARETVFFDDEYLKIFESSNPSLVTSGNHIQVNPSSMTFNSLLTLQVSTQRVGIFTRNPQFDLDVQRHGYLDNLKASTIQTSLIFLSLQSI